MVPSPTDPPPTNCHISRELSFKICLKSNLECGSTPQPLPFAAPLDGESEPSELRVWCPGARRVGRLWSGRGAGARRHQRDVARALAAASGERGLRRKRRRRGLWPPLLGPGFPAGEPPWPRGAPGAARGRESRRGAAARPAPQPGWRQSRRPRRRQAGRVRTAGAPDLAGGGVSKALCLMASLFTEFTL